MKNRTNYVPDLTDTLDRGFVEELRENIRILRSKNDRIHVRVGNFVKAYGAFITAGIVIMIVLIPFVALAAVTYFVACNKKLNLGTWGRAGLGAAGVWWMYLKFAGTMEAYFLWLWSGGLAAVNEQFEAAGFPYWDVAGTGAAIGAVACMVYHSGILAAIKGWLKNAFKRFRRKEHRVVEKVDLGLTDSAFEAAAIAGSTGSTGRRNLDSKLHEIKQVGKDGDRNIQFPIGIYDNNGKEDVYRIDTRDYGTHGVVFGTTGSGKTEALKRLIWGFLQAGWDGIVVDLKEDTGEGGLRDWVKRYAEVTDTDYQELLMGELEENEYWLDACYGLSEAEVESLLLTFIKGDDAYWHGLVQKCMKACLWLAFRSHELRPDKYGPVTLKRLVRMHMGIVDGNPASVKKAYAEIFNDVRAALKTEGERKELDYDMMDTVLQPGKDVTKQFDSFATKVKLLISGGYGQALFVGGQTPDGKERKRIDVAKPGIVYMGADSAGGRDAAKFLSSSVLQRVTLEMGRRSRAGKQKVPLFVMVDEASVVNRDLCNAILSKGRSARISLILATQSPNDWIDEEGDGFTQMMANVNVRIYMRQSETLAAELCSKQIGTETGAVARMELDEYNVVTESARARVEEGVVRFGPDRLKDELGNGVAIVHVTNSAAAQEESSGLKALKSVPNVVAFVMVPMPGEDESYDKRYGNKGGLAGTPAAAAANGLSGFGAGPVDIPASSPWAAGDLKPLPMGTAVSGTESSSDSVVDDDGDEWS